MICKQNQGVEHQYEWRFSRGYVLKSPKHSYLGTDLSTLNCLKLNTYYVTGIFFQEFYIHLIFKTTQGQRSNLVSHCVDDVVEAQRGQASSPNHTAHNWNILNVCQSHSKALDFCSLSNDYNFNVLCPRETLSISNIYVAADRIENAVYYETGNLAL